MPTAPPKQQQGSRDRGSGAYRPLLRGSLHELLNIQRTQIMEEQKQPDHHGGIAHAGHDECFASRPAIRRVPVPEPDEQITRQADAFPSQVKQQKVVRQKQRQHRGDEQIHVCEESGIAVVVDHEFGRVKVNQKADKGHYQHHDQGESDRGRERSPGGSRRRRAISTRLACKRSRPAERSERRTLTSRETRVEAAIEPVAIQATTLRGKRSKASASALTKGIAGTSQRRPSIFNLSYCARRRYRWCCADDGGEGSAPDRRRPPTQPWPG